MTLMDVTVLDINNDRIWAITGADGRAPRLVYLNDKRAELPLALSLERRKVAVGRAALEISRISPHLVCADFLAELGGSRIWSHGRHRLTAADAVKTVFLKLKESLPADGSVVLAVPANL